MDKEAGQSYVSGLPSVLVIEGPTGTGKSAFAIDIACSRDGELVNADSRYFYRGFDIGTAKPTKAEQARIPHHLIDILEPDEEMSLVLFQRLAYLEIEKIIARGDLPVLVGGTPQYLNAIIEGWQVPEVAPQPELRAELEGETAETLEQMLREVDPVSAKRTSGNPRRMIRALEVFQVTGQPISTLQTRQTPPYRFLEIGLTMPRTELYSRIDARVDQMVEHGLLDEVRSLLASGVDPESPAFSSIGYRQWLPYLAGEITKEEAIGRIKFATHRYVRHQQTWLRRNQRVITFDTTDAHWQLQVMALVRPFLDDR